MSETLSVTVELLGVLKGHNGWVTSVCVGTKNDKPLLLSGSRDRTVLVWDLDLETQSQSNTEEGNLNRVIGKPFRALKGHNHFVSCLSITSDSKFAVSGSWDKTLRLWDLNTYKTKCVLVGHTKDVLSCSFSTDSRIIYSGSMDKSVKLWNLNGECKFTEDKESKGWYSSIINIKKGKEGPLVATGSWDCLVRFFDKDFNKIKAIGSIDYPVVGLAADEAGEFLFVGEKKRKNKNLGIKSRRGK